jgi:exo-beta-1,3-glucanase (GH17 family)
VSTRIQSLATRLHPEHQPRTSTTSGSSSSSSSRVSSSSSSSTSSSSSSSSSSGRCNDGIIVQQVGGIGLAVGEGSDASQSMALHQPIQHIHTRVYIYYVGDVCALDAVCSMQYMYALDVCTGWTAGGVKQQHVTQHVTQRVASNGPIRACHARDIM